MANVTRQTNNSRGQDGTTASRGSTANTSSDRQSSGGGSRTSATEKPVTTKQTTKAAKRTTTEKADAQTNASQEDHAFTISFSVPLKGAVPCTPTTI